MPTYSYSAISSSGERVSGTEIAESERDLARVLREKGYIVTTSNAGEKKQVSISFQGLLGNLMGVGLTDKLMFTRNLKVMVTAGIPFPKALDVLAQQTKNKRFADVLLAVKKRVVQGRTISQALEEHPDVFPELFTNMMRVGEESGTLENVLSQLTLQLERQYDLKSKIKGALMYPAVIIVAMIGIGTLMLVVVVPKLAATFADLDVALPPTTKFVIGVGTFFAEQWYVALPGAVILLFLLWRVSSSKPGKRVVGSVDLKIPLISGIVRKTNAALMTRTLSSLLTAGVPIVRAVEITSRVLGNVHFRESLAQCAESVRRGSRLSAALRAHENLYPLIIIQMVEVGEETGETGQILAKLAEFFEEEVANLTRNLAALLEPILMLIVGAVVGFFAVSMIQPMYSMLGSIQ